MLTERHTAFGSGKQSSDIGPVSVENGQCNNKPENHEMIVKTVMKKDRGAKKLYVIIKTAAKLEKILATINILTGAIPISIPAAVLTPFPPLKPAKRVKT